MEPRSADSESAEAALVAAARAVSERAHSPYSGVRVGAALATADGRVFAGCNVESASFGLTICAERAALVQAVAHGARSFEQLAVVANRAEPLMPCGACRQLLHELCGAELRVLCVGEDGARFETRLGELLPHAFGAADLDREQSEGCDA
jgi:cytidine deaminase